MPGNHELIWTPGALDDLSRLRAFIEPHNPQAAAKAATAIITGANRLLDNPSLGHTHEGLPEFRKLSIPFGRRGYVLKYWIDGQKIVVLRIWHTREKSVDL